MNTPTAGTTPRPADIFLNLIITFLTPMFLATTGGNVPMARAVAAAAVNAYTARSPADLLPIAMVIALGLTILDSLSRSMDDALPLKLILRLRGNAVSLGRLAEQARNALPPDATPPAPAIGEAAERRRQDAALAAVIQAEHRLAEVQASRNTPHSSQHRVPAAKPPAQPDHYQAAWATAMTDVAGEFATRLEGLPPDQRKAASIRANVLSSVAQQLLSGDAMPPGPFAASR